MKKFSLYVMLSTLLSFSSLAQKPITVLEKTFKIGGFTDEIIYYGFAEGDQIFFSFEEINGKVLKEIEIVEYPSSSKFMDFKTSKIESKTIKVSKTGIYSFRFSNSAIGGRICKCIIQRIPSSEETVSFNTSVSWRTISDTVFYTEQERYLVKKEYIPKTIIASTDYYINSGLNATFQGGKSRISFPFTLPKGTTEWYYQFSATRNKEDLEQTKSTFNLLSDLSTLIDQTGALSFGIDALSQPPGANYCDIYLLDHLNSQLFLAKEAYSCYTSATRENIKSGIVKVEGGSNQSYYLGIKNPDSSNGIHVAIEIVAIVLNEVWDTREVEKYNIETRKEPYLQDN